MSNDKWLIQQKTVPEPSLVDLLNRLLLEIQSILKNQFVGLYVGGSIANDSFNQETSDIDCYIVTTAMLSKKNIRQIESMHKQFYLSNIPYANKIEASYISQQDLLNFNPESTRPYFNEGNFYLAPYGNNFLIELFILREKGITIAGQEIRDLIKELSPEDLQQAIKKNLYEYWETSLNSDKFKRSDYQVFAVLTMCRTLYSLEHGNIISKTLAAQWIINKAHTNWKNLIEKALEWKLGTELNQQKEAEQFVRDVLDTINDTSQDTPEQQIKQCVNLLKDILGKDILGVYLYGSTIVGGLQKYSDIDLFVVTDRATTHEEKAKLEANLLQISGIYMKNSKCPLEMTIVNKSEINPWHYPSNFDFQYGEWLRKEFESGNIEPWPAKEMPDLALLVTQVLLASKTLVGVNPDQLLCEVPYKDFLMATTDALPNLMSDLDNDTRNVLLTFARIWSTVETDTIRSKPAAADWAIDCLPEKYHPVMNRAKAISKGEVEEYWDDIRELIKPCADFMLAQINNDISKIQLSDCANKSIKLEVVYS